MHEIDGGRVVLPGQARMIDVVRDVLVLADAADTNGAFSLVETGHDAAGMGRQTYPEAARLAGGGPEPMVVSLEPHSIADVFATVRLVSRLAGVEERGNALVAGLTRRLDALRLPARRPRVALVEWLSPPFAPGHWVPEQVERAGGVSVIGEAGERSRESTWDALAATDPHVVVLCLCGFDLQRSLEEWAAFDAPEPVTRTRAWRDGHIRAIDGSAYVSRPGPRVVDGAEVLSAKRQARIPSVTARRTDSSRSRAR